jgi:nitrite reductase/ring-hydroxylating ferredoxin subunit
MNNNDIKIEDNSNTRTEINNFYQIITEVKGAIKIVQETCSHDETTPIKGYKNKKRKSVTCDFCDKVINEVNNNRR